jgi:hypothetical protein
MKSIFTILSTRLKMERGAERRHRFTFKYDEMDSVTGIAEGVMEAKK